jgi:hypothetical protein
LHLKKKARAIDAGSSELAPDIDHDKASRPWGDGYDIGAYEYHEGDVGADSAKQKESKATENHGFWPRTIRSWLPALVAVSVLVVVWLVRR